MKYYLIAGEASGDLHGANLIKELRICDPQAEFRCWGGDRMQAEGGVIVKHIKELAFMGFIEVITNLRTILKNLSFCKKDILNYQPDCVILLDYPGFNLRISKFCAKQKITNFYYIAPQVWAWKKRRVYAMSKTIDHLFVILPFEQKFFEKYDINVSYMGNPLLDEIHRREPFFDDTRFRERNGLSPHKPIISILPGSRSQELKKILSLQLSIVSKHPEFEFVIAGVSHLPRSLYHEAEAKHIPIVFDQTYDLLHASHSALVTSGTATLEAALFRVPEVVCYKANHISYLIARAVANVKYISLVNLVCDEEVVRELIQKDLSTDNLDHEFRAITQDSLRRKEMLEKYDSLALLMGEAGSSKKVAEKITQELA